MEPNTIDERSKYCDCPDDVGFEKWAYEMIEVPEHPNPIPRAKLVCTECELLSKTSPVRQGRQFKQDLNLLLEAFGFWMKESERD